MIEKVKPQEVLSLIYLSPVVHLWMLPYVEVLNFNNFSIILHNLIIMM